MSKLTNFKKACERASKYDQTQIGFAIGVLTFMVVSFFLHTILSKMLAASIVLVWEYFGRVHKEYKNLNW